MADRVKNAVCDELNRVDPTANIRKTHYFNHGWLPDIVARWPQDGAEREVFLRSTWSEQFVADLQRNESSAPVVIVLASAFPDEETTPVSARDILVASRQAPQTLITDTEATEHVRPSQTASLFERLLASHVLSSGRGVLSEQKAVRSLGIARDALEASQGRKKNEVAAALNVFSRVVGDDVERKAERSLKLYWWANGGTTSEFPSRHPDDQIVDTADISESLRRSSKTTLLLSKTIFGPSSLSELTSTP